MITSSKTLFIITDDYISAHSTGTKTYHRRDNAPDPLFSWVDEAVLRRPTYHTFIKLLDNYEAGTGQAEVVTREEKRENWAFINACMTTKVCALHVYILLTNAILYVSC